MQKETTKQKTQTKQAKEKPTERRRQRKTNSVPVARWAPIDINAIISKNVAHKFLCLENHDFNSVFEVLVIF